METTQRILIVWNSRQHTGVREGKPLNPQMLQHPRPQLLTVGIWVPTVDGKGRYRRRHMLLSERLASTRVIHPPNILPMTSKSRYRTEHHHSSALAPSSGLRASMEQAG
jgi:hypothetical protein